LIIDYPLFNLLPRTLEGLSAFSFEELSVLL